MRISLPTNHYAHTRKSFFLGFFAIIIVMCALIVFQSKRTSATVLVSIPEGTSIIQAGSILKDHKVIRSKIMYRVFSQMNKKSIKAGSYLFQEHEGLFTVIQRLALADYGDVYIKITLPEGGTLVQMSEVLASSSLKNFSQEQFIELAQDKEGYLFPDTYFFLPDHSTQDIVDIMEHTFEEKIADLPFEQSERSKEDIIIMASLIQKEASHNLEEKKMVAGILWKRIDEGMLLQVDAPFLYALGKGSAQLSTKNLTTDHPYNTYTRKGLTPTAIGNPGLDAIMAALEPSDSPYYFYLHDGNGGIHYGRNHDEHLRNKRMYIN